MQQNKVKSIFAFIWMPRDSNVVWQRKIWLAGCSAEVGGFWVFFFFMARKCIGSDHRNIFWGILIYVCGAWCFQDFLKMEFCLCLSLWHWGKVQAESLADRVILSSTVQWLSNRVSATLVLRNKGPCPKSVQSMFEI